MFLVFFIFDPNRPFCKGYSLCMGYSLCKMADFQNCLISRIFSVFSSGFFAQNNHNVLEKLFSFMFLAFSIFDPNWPFCKCYSLCMGCSLYKMSDFQNCLISRIFSVFSSGFFAQNNHNVLEKLFSFMFLAFSIFDPNWPFCKCYSLCMGCSL